MRRLFSFAFWLLMLGVGALKIAEWTTENWWMDALGFGAQARLYWIWRLSAFVPAFGLWALIMGLNARLAWHNAHWRDVSLPLLGPRSTESQNAMSPDDRARLEILARRSARIFIGLSALLCGVAAANHFDLWVLALSGASWGAREASGGQDIGFFVWVLPAFLWAWNALGTLFLFTLLLVASIAAFGGVLDFDARGLRVGDATAGHLAFLGALLIGWIGARCGLAMLSAPINFGWSPNGVFSFYDQTFTQPARFFFLMSALPAAIWFARAAPRRFGRALLSATLWSLAALLLPMLAPSFGRAVWPHSASLDATLSAQLQDHIETTRRAWDLDKVQERALNVKTSDFLVGDTGPNDQTSALPVVAWPRDALRRALEFDNTDNNRIPGDVFISRENGQLTARVVEVNPSASSATSALALVANPSANGGLTTRRVTFAAVVLAPPGISRSTGTFGPSTLPPTMNDGSSNAVQVREVAPDFAIKREDIWQGLALATRFGDRSLLAAGPPITWHLDPIERLEAVAPMVYWEDARPHPVLMSVAGDDQKHLFWETEGCFVSRNFPGAAMSQEPNSWSGITYARQSVLGVCDASTGETTLYAFDDKEPFTRVWESLLPGLFRPVEELRDVLRKETRLSLPLNSAQCEMWTRYHTPQRGANEPLDWAKRSDQWRVLTPDQRDDAPPDDTVLLGPPTHPALSSLCAFAPLFRTSDSLASNSAQADTTNQTTHLIAMLGTCDEGAELWQARGHAPRTNWRASPPLSLPSDESGADTLSPIALERWRKSALWPDLDVRGNIVGLSLFSATATPQKNATGPRAWTLATRLFSTLPTRTEKTPAASGDSNLPRLRTLWRAWKQARAAGRWSRVESLEAAINRILSP